MEKKIFTVGPELLNDPDISPTPSFRITYPDGSKEVLSATIEGFEFEPGVTQQIEVGIAQIPDPPPGASSLRYELIRVVSRRQD